MRGSRGALRRRRNRLSPCTRAWPKSERSEKRRRERIERRWTGRGDSRRSCRRKRCWSCTQARPQDIGCSKRSPVEPQRHSVAGVVFVKMPVFSQKDDDDYNKHKSILFNLCKSYICLSSSQLRYSSWWLCYCFCIMAGNTRMRTQPPARRSAKAVPKCAIFNPRTSVISGAAVTKCGSCSFSRWRWHVRCGH